MRKTALSALKGVLDQHNVKSSIAVARIATEADLSLQIPESAKIKVGSTLFTRDVDAYYLGAILNHPSTINNKKIPYLEIELEDSNNGADDRFQLDGSTLQFRLKCEPKSMLFANLVEHDLISNLMLTTDLTRQTLASVVSAAYKIINESADWINEAPKRIITQEKIKATTGAFYSSFRDLVYERQEGTLTYVCAENKKLAFKIFRVCDEYARAALEKDVILRKPTLTYIDADTMRLDP